MDTDLYTTLKARFPQDTVDITPERILIVSGDFQGLNPRERVYRALHYDPPLGYRRVVCVTPAEVKQMALDNPSATTQSPPETASFILERIERMSDEIRRADLHGLSSDAAVQLRSILVLMSALAREILDLRLEIKRMKEPQ